MILLSSYFKKLFCHSERSEESCKRDNKSYKILRYATHDMLFIKAVIARLTLMPAFANAFVFVV